MRSNKACRRDKCNKKVDKRKLLRTLVSVSRQGQKIVGPSPNFQNIKICNLVGYTVVLAWDRSILGEE